jgi:hypothetical protein
MKGYNVGMDDKDMKIQALSERIAQDAVRTSNEIADLRVSLTNALSKLQELEEYVAQQEKPKQAEEFTATAVNSN